MAKCSIYVETCHLRLRCPKRMCRNCTGLGHDSEACPENVSNDSLPISVSVRGWATLEIHPKILSLIVVRSVVSADWDDDCCHILADYHMVGLSSCSLQAFWVNHVWFSSLLFQKVDGWNFYIVSRVLPKYNLIQAEVYYAFWVVWWVAGADCVPPAWLSTERRLHEWGRTEQDHDFVGSRRSWNVPFQCF